MRVLALASDDVLDEVIDTFLGDNASLQHEAIDQRGTEALEDLGLHGLVGVQQLALNSKSKRPLILVTSSKVR